MSNILTISVSRKADGRSTARRGTDTVVLEPTTPRASPASKKSGSDTGFRSAAARFLDQRWLRFFGDYATLPDAVARGRPTAADPEADFNRLSATLRAAWADRNAEKLETTATAYLDRSGLGATTDFDRMTRDIYDFFQARGCDASGAELLAFVSSFPEKDLIAYLRESAGLVSKLKAQALAAMVNGTLSKQPMDLFLVIKAIGAFQLVAGEFLKGRREPGQMPVKLVCAMLDIDLSFPEWCFDVDPCRWHKPPGDGKSLLRAQIEREQRARPGGEVDATQTPGAPPRRDAATGAAVVDPCDCSGDLDPPCLPPDPCCAEINYYVADLLVLRDRTLGYVASDLAFITNIAASERTERKHQFVRTIEDFTEEETNVTRREEHDLTQTDRFSVQNEMEKSLKLSANTQASFRSGPYAFSGSASVARDTAQREAREQFREAVDKAVSSLQVQTRKLSSRRITTREEEQNVHGFDNSDGRTHFVAKYFYVTKQAEGQVFSHGLRTSVQLLLPSPSALYEHLEKVRIERSFPLKKPKPFELGEKEITKENYEQLGTDYGVRDLPAPPEKPADQLEQIVVDADLPTDKDQPSGSLNYTDIADRPGFFISSFEISGNLSYDEVKNRQLSDMTFEIGGINVWRSYDKDDNLTGSRDKSGPVHFKGPVPLIIKVTNVDSLSTTINIVWSAEEPDLTEWRKTVWTRINDKYEKLNEEYAAAWAEHERRERERAAGRHPLVRKEILTAELKRAAIYMMCQEFERGGVMNMKSWPCGYPELNRSAAAEHCWDWYFWERAFDWSLMSFIFYDYFWNRMCDWPEKFAPGDSDFMFNAFQRAGLGKLEIPMAVGMEEDVIFYLETGQKWGFDGKPPVKPGDTGWIGIVEELKHSRDCYQNDREGRVVAILDPTTLAATNKVLLSGSDRYWDPLTGTIDQVAIDIDTGREIFIAGLAYRIVAIALSPTSPPYNPSAPMPTMQWVISLERDFEGAAKLAPDGTVYPDHAHAIGAAFVGAPFRWEEPTNLVWLSDAGNVCLPTYPVKC